MTDVFCLTVLLFLMFGLGFVVGVQYMLSRLKKSGYDFHYDEATKKWRPMNHEQ